MGPEQHEPPHWQFQARYDINQNSSNALGNTLTDPVFAIRSCRIPEGIRGKERALSEVCYQSTRLVVMCLFVCQQVASLCQAPPVRRTWSTRRCGLQRTKTKWSRGSGWPTRIREYALRICSIWNQPDQLEISMRIRQAPPSHLSLALVLLSLHRLYSATNLWNIEPC